MAITQYDEKFTLTAPDGSIVEIYRDGETIEWTGYVNATEMRRNGIGGSETWSNPSCAALRVAADLAHEAGYRLTGHDGQPDYEDDDPTDAGHEDEE